MPDPNDLRARLEAMAREKMLAPDKGSIFIHPMKAVALDLLQRLEEQEARVKDLTKALERCMPHEVARLNVRDFDKPDFIYIGSDYERNKIARAALSATPLPPETEVK